jgi:hypothetical protein
VPIDRVAEQKPYYSGKHKRHGVNVQVLADPAGRLVWASPALPGATHDLVAARVHGLLDALTFADVMIFADKGYQGAGGIRVPFKRLQPRAPPQRPAHPGLGPPRHRRPDPGPARRRPDRRVHPTPTPTGRLRLAEALALRGDAASRRTTPCPRGGECARYQEGEVPAEDATALLIEAAEVLGELTPG